MTLLKKFVIGSAFVIICFSSMGYQAQAGNRNNPVVTERLSPGESVFIRSHREIVKFQCEDQQLNVRYVCSEDGYKTSLYRKEVVEQANSSKKTIIEDKVAEYDLVEDCFSAADKRNKATRN